MEFIENGPVRILQGTQDQDTLLHHALRVPDILKLNDIVTHIIKNGDHRLLDNVSLARWCCVVDAVLRRFTRVP